jgi:transposase
VIGLDPHKKMHGAIVITRDYTVQTRFKFENSRAGFEKAMTTVKCYMDRTQSRNIIFAIEAGGHYWRNIAYFLDEQGISFRVVNPFTIKRVREGKDINRVKNDFRDARAAAELVLEGQCAETQLPQGIYAELRIAHTAYNRLLKEASRAKNRTKSILDTVFPEFATAFNNICGDTALQMLSTCPIPGVIAGLSQDEFIKQVRTGFMGHALKLQKLRDIYKLSLISSGINAGANCSALELSFLAQQLKLLSQQINHTKHVITELLAKLNESSYLLSIKGLGIISAAGIIAEVGPFGAYKNAGQLIKLAGTNPTEWESAGKKHSNTPMSKKGRPGLRSCIWMAAINLLRCNPDFKQWAKERRERPLYQHPLTARQTIGAAGNRLLRIAFGLVKNKSMYILPELVLTTA